jgi:hypothetical protein
MYLSHSIQTITTLNLRSNKISVKGARHLANGLQQNTVRLIFYFSISYLPVSLILTMINLQNNEIRTVGAQDLINDMEIDPSIVKFW